MKNVLFIVYYFPPLGGSGVQRTLKFAKYLRDFGWNPIVLCPEPGAYHTYDDSLTAELNDLNLQIYRVKDKGWVQQAVNKKSDKELKVNDGLAKRLRRIVRTFYFPDNKKGWIAPAVEQGIKIIESEKIDVIFSSAPPFSNHIVGSQLKEKTGIPLVVDYRDSWTNNHFQTKMWGWQKTILRNQERGVLATADKVVCLDNFIRSEFIKDYPVIAERLEVLPHGFDAGDFTSDSATSTFKYQKEKLNFLYSGLFYEDNQPDSFLKAIRKLLDNHSDIQNKLALHFQGGLDERIHQLIKSLGLSELVFDYGYINHNVAARNLKEADVLWMISNFDPELKQIKSGKLFEYIGAKRPIIGLVHPSEASMLLKEYGAGISSKPTSIEETFDSIYSMFKKWELNELPTPNEDFVAKFDRKKLTGKLSQIFNVISS